MFKKMGEAGFAARIVGGADPVPHGLRHRGNPVVRQHDNLHAVGQRKALDLEFLRLGRPFHAREREKQDQREQTTPQGGRTKTRKNHPGEGSENALDAHVGQYTPLRGVVSRLASVAPAALSPELSSRLAMLLSCTCRFWSSCAPGAGESPSDDARSAKVACLPGSPGPAESITRRARSAAVTSFGRVAPGVGGRRLKSGGIRSGARDSTANSSGPVRSMPSTARISLQPASARSNRQAPTSDAVPTRLPAARSCLVIARHLPPGLPAAPRAATVCRPAKSPLPQDKSRSRQD